MTQAAHTRVIFALFILTALNCEVTHALANKGAWTSRPLVPEMAKSPEEVSSDENPIKSKAREPWDAIRFVKQSSKFISLPKPFPTSSKIVEPGQILWEPSSSSSKIEWAPLDDVVMGGVSSSTFDNASGIWRGTISENNSGGFVGIRTRPLSAPFDMTGCKGLEYRFRVPGGGGMGDREIKAVVRDSTDFNGVCWTSCLTIPGSRGGANVVAGLDRWFGKKKESDGNADKGNIVTVRVPFAEQVPTIFARRVPNQEFDASNVVGFQLVYSKFQFDGELNPKFELGDFTLQAMDIKTF